MVLFSGKASGLADFYSTEATDGFDLCEKLFPDWRRQDIPNRFRMWVEIPAATASATNETYWADVCLKSGNSNIYKITAEEALKVSETVKVIIRGAEDTSPNASPTGGTGTEAKTQMELLPPSTSPRALKTVQSNLTASTVGMSPVSSKTITDSFKTFEISGALNTKEPFTCVDIAEASEETSKLNLIPLFFQKKQKQRAVTNHSIVLVDLESLEQFVENQIRKGVGPLNICLTHVPCHGGDKDFALTSDVWIGSMLPRSRYFRVVFVSAGCAEACRTAALKELKTEAPRLFDHLLFWVEDLLDLEEAQWRLEARFEATGVCKLMSPYYFTEPEARYLGNFFVDGSTIP